MRPVIVTSGPAVSYPSLAYRNPLSKLLSFLTDQHQEDWCIFEFRAEGTGYSDKAVQGRVRHFPWPDHHPPPFAVMPELLESMRAWLDGSVAAIGNDNDLEIAESDEKKKRVAILHCKAGKGRSGTVATSFLISMRGWTVEDALKRFTERRMRPGWGEGISIKSQRRTIEYVNRWAKWGKKYQSGKVKVIELQLWCRREGVNVMIRGFVKEGKKIKVLYKWKDAEGETQDISSEQLVDKTMAGSTDLERLPTAVPSKSTQLQENPSHNDSELITEATTPTENGHVPALVTSETGASIAPATLTILRPMYPLIVDTLDVNIQVERRNRTSFGLPSVVTSTAHSWFNAYFEGNGPERHGEPERTGSYTVEWDAMDGLKGSSKRGVRAIEKVCVVWEILDDEDAAKEQLIAEEAKHHHIPRHESASSEEHTDIETASTAQVATELQEIRDPAETTKAHLEHGSKTNPA